MRSTERPAPGRGRSGPPTGSSAAAGRPRAGGWSRLSGGPARTRIVLVLGSVLALSSADAATVGAAAVQLRHALQIGNTDIGLLVAVTSLVGAVFSVPFGVLADRVRRTWMLGIAIVIWGVAMIWGATAHSFGQLMLDRVWLGAVTAATAARGGLARRGLVPGRSGERSTATSWPGSWSGPASGSPSPATSPRCPGARPSSSSPCPRSSWPGWSSGCRSRPAAAKACCAPEPGYGQAAARNTLSLSRRRQTSRPSRPTPSGWPANAASRPTPPWCGWPPGAR